MAGISQTSKHKMWVMYNCRRLLTNILYVQHLFVYRSIFFKWLPPKTCNWPWFLNLIWLYMLNINLPSRFYRFYIQMFLTTIAWREDLKYCLSINRLFQHWGSKFYVTQVDISDNCVIKYCWIINISTECLKWHLLLWQMQESMLCIHVC